jgi:pilus assembly protein Flp/PilA
MGETQPNGGLSDAAGRRAAGRLAARFALSFLGDQSGATAIEYGLIVSLIFLAVIGAISSFGNKFTDIMNIASSNISGAL